MSKNASLEASEPKTWKKADKLLVVLKSLRKIMTAKKRSEH